MSYNPSSSTTTPTSTVKLETIILCQHGYQGNSGTFTKLFENLNNLGQVTLTNVLTKDTPVSVYENIAKTDAKKVFIRTQFSNKIGRVAEQVKELNTIIEGLKKATGNSVKFILVGHSKGGLVNMRYSIDYPGKVQKLISVGTPYNPNIMGFAQSLLDDISFVCTGISVITALLNAYVSDEDLGSTAFYEKLKRDWNNLPISQKPIITTIGASQIGFNANINTGGDLVVSLASQQANGYSNINSRPVVSENYIHVNHYNWKDQLKIHFNLIERTTDEIQALQALSTGDALGALLGLILTTMIPNNKDNKTYNLIHTREFGNNTIAREVLNGVNLEKPSTLKPIINLRYY